MRKSDQRGRTRPYPATTPTLAIFLLWLGASALSPVAIGVHLFRRGARGVAMSFLCPLGTIAMSGFVSAAIGVADGAWGAHTLGLWIASTIGIAGVVLNVIGWRAALRQPRRPGQCPTCGYELAGATICAQCGRSASVGDGSD